MSLPHFFLENQVLSEESVEVFELRLSADDLKHACVMRLKSGEHLAVIDAVSDYFECCVETCDKLGLYVRITQHLEAPERPSVLLAQGMAKGDKMDMIIRHATELGIAGFIPLICERSVVKLDQKKTANRMKRWQTIAKSAAMQSGQSRIPELVEPCSLQDLMPCIQGATAVLICWEEAPLTKTISQALLSAKRTLRQDARDARIVVIVGPEGGLSEHEVASLLESHDRASLVSLGPSILRTETAGIVAPALVLYELERTE